MTPAHPTHNPPTPSRYANISQLPVGFVDMVKKYNPHITELELSRCRGGRASQRLIWD